MDKTVVVARGLLSAATRSITSGSRAPASSLRTTRTTPAKQGDLVRIEETRPISKNKRWIVREIVEQGPDLESSVDLTRSQAARRKEP